MRPQSVAKQYSTVSYPSYYGYSTTYHVPTDSDSDLKVRIILFVHRTFLKDSRQEDIDDKQNSGGEILQDYRPLSALILHLIRHLGVAVGSLVKW